MKLIGTLLIVCGMAAAQPPPLPNPVQLPVASVPATADAPVPVYRVTVVARTTKAINYNHRSGSTKIDFRGTPLLPQARGEATVESKQGVIKIDARMEKLEPAGKFGPEYLTYVLWAITPEGRATNVGELLLNGGKTKINATSELQSFGLIVTAEPYFAVTQPSDVVVMENFVRHDTTGTIEQVDAKFELLQRGQYTLNVNPAEIKAAKLNRKVPLELYEARNAVQIARWAGADRYAADTYQKAVTGLENAEGYLTGKSGSKPIGTVAREAVQMAEDARLITVKKIAEEQLANERQAGADREASANAARIAAQNEAERTERNAEAARITAQNEAARAQLDNAVKMQAAQNDADRQKLDSDALLAATEAKAARAKMDAEAERMANQAKLDAAAKQMAELEQQKVELRTQLLQQFNAILQTRDTPRGLVVNMTDVLFDTGKYTLRPIAREKLAKLAGIVSGHPGLRLDVEGHTDSVGSDFYNQKLSENRGVAVRDFLTKEGMAATSITTKGFGKTQPVASNDTSEGRQENRRVELVISGEIIGTRIGTPVAAR